MTEKIWSYFNEKNLKRDDKVKLFLFVRSLIYIVIGLILWLVLHLSLALRPDWGLCILLSMTILGYVGGIFFLYRKY